MEKKVGQVTLSAVVVGSFVIYSFFVHASGMDNMPILDKKSPDISAVSANAATSVPQIPTPTVVSAKSTQMSTPTNVVSTVAPASPPPQGQQSQPALTDTPVPQQPAPTSPPQQTGAGYKDGSYTGSVANAFYGNVQVQATIQGGNITGVQFLQYPNDRPNSVAINSQAMPILQQEAIQAQSNNVSIVSGATDTSQAFIASLGSALTQAQ